MESHNNTCCCHPYNGHFSSVIKCICIRKPHDHPDIKPHNNIYYNVCNKTMWQKDKPFKNKNNSFEPKVIPYEHKVIPLEYKYNFNELKKIPFEHKYTPFEHKDHHTEQKKKCCL